MCASHTDIRQAPGSWRPPLTSRKKFPLPLILILYGHGRPARHPLSDVASAARMRVDVPESVTDIGNGPLPMFAVRE
jgi:hypothetical protein